MTLDELRSRVTCTVEQAAVALGVSRSSAYEAARRGEIPTIRVGRRLRVSCPALLSMLADPGAQTAPDVGAARDLDDRTPDAGRVTVTHEP